MVNGFIEQIYPWIYKLSEMMKEINFFSITFRLILAAIFAGIIGIDRGKKRRGAGFKTHVLVSLGSALVMLTGQYIYFEFGGGDIARLGAQVISGIGFLGAGTIIVTGNNQVQGLTTAAGLWTCSCIGLAIGIGFYYGAIVVFGIVTILYGALNCIEAYIYNHANVINLYIELAAVKNVGSFMETIKNCELRISNLQTIRPRKEKDGIAFLATIELGKVRTNLEVMNLLSHIEGIEFIEEL